MWVFGFIGGARVILHKFPMINFICKNLGKRVKEFGNLSGKRIRQGKLSNLLSDLLSCIYLLYWCCIHRQVLMIETTDYTFNDWNN